MKLSILIAALFLSTTAQATDRHQPQNPQATAGAIGLGVGVGGAGGAGGAVGNVTGGSIMQDNDYSDLRIVPPAIAPNVNANIICPMIIPNTKALSIFLISVSGTKGYDLVPICVAHHLGQREVVQRMTCDADKAYAKANPACVK